MDAHWLEQRLGRLSDGFDNPLPAPSVNREQGLNFAAQLPVAGTGVVKKARSLFREQVCRFQENTL
ncbi:MAG: hypothetical protein ABSD20_22095, partial [Terriglobales bacterium]